MIRIFISLFSTRHFILTIIVMFIAVSSYASKDSSVSSLPRIVGTEESDIFRVSMMLSLFEKRQMCLIQPRFGTSLMVFFNEDVQEQAQYEQISKLISKNSIPAVIVLTKEPRSYIDSGVLHQQKRMFYIPCNVTRSRGPGVQIDSNKTEYLPRCYTPMLEQENYSIWTPLFDLFFSHDRPCYSNDTPCAIVYWDQGLKIAFINRNTFNSLGRISPTFRKMSLPQKRQITLPLLLLVFILTCILVTAVVVHKLIKHYQSTLVTKVWRDES